MFSNSVYNFPTQFNENLLLENFSDLSLNAGQTYQQQQQQQQQQTSINNSGFVPSTLNQTNVQWPINSSYQQGPTIINQYNNSMIDDYYKKFAHPISELPANNQSNYVYQNPTGTVPIQQFPTGNEILNQSKPNVSANVSQTNIDGTDDKKHKKKHKKRSSKHGHENNPQQINEQRTEINDKFTQQTVSSVPVDNAHHYPQQSMVSAQHENQNSQVQMRHDSNPVVYFDIEIDGDARGRLVMELFRHVLPRTAQNFLSLCLNEHGFGFRRSYFHRIIPGFMAQGGDFEKSDGTGGYSIYGEKFDDEGFPFLHDRPGLLSMANCGPNTNGSQFFITFVPCPHLDKKHVVFGQILQGFHLLKDFEMSGTDNGDVIREVLITNSGQLQ